MGLYLIASAAVAASTFEIYAQNAWFTFLVVIGLGGVIFVHELGHFLVAKACGVQCDKFYIGFDVPIKIPFLGWLLSKIGLPPKSEDGEVRLPAALYRKQWGETEYGIGIIPLGGYVKMLGQDDNPANAAKELERARLHKEQLAEREALDVAAVGTEKAKAEDAASEEPETAAEMQSEASSDEFVLNPRSYLAKSVPQRMAIISAGVIMNIIFAFIFATVAYMLGDGVRYMPCVVSEVVPGSPAWRANVQPGDEIIKIGTTPKPKFRDLQTNVMLGDLENGVPLQIKRPGVEEILSLIIRPEQKATGLPTIGIMSPRTLTLTSSIDPVVPNSTAASATPAFARGDRLVAANDEPLASDRDLLRILTRDASKPIEFRVARDQHDEEGNVTSTEELAIRVAPNPMKRIGVIMDIGPIVAVQAESPAAKAGIQAGDFIERIDDQAVGDPMTLADRLRVKAETQRSVTLQILRDSSNGPQPKDIPIPMRTVTTVETPLNGAPQSIPSLGIAYRVLNRISSVIPGSPAEQAGLTAGDFVTLAQFIPASDLDADKAAILTKAEIPFKDAQEDTQPNWPSFVSTIQNLPPGTQVKLTVTDADGNEKQVSPLTPEASTEQFVPDRGLIQQPLEARRKADSVGEAVVMGYTETWDGLTMVYRFLHKLTTKQVPIGAVGGPGTIAKAAFAQASRGIPDLLVFLTMLSANLAVVNFLPIPVLDGGHMVFLIYEGIFRRPVSEKIVAALSTLGLVFLMTLMIYVIGLDIGIWDRNL